MSKKTTVSASSKKALKLKVLAKKKEGVRRRLVVTATKLRLKAKKLAVTAKKKETIRRKLVVTSAKPRLKAKKLAVRAKEKESVRRRLVVTAEKLAVTARERESVRRRLVVTAEQLRLKAKQLAVTAKERETIRRKLEVTAGKLAVTAKERETIRRRLVVTAENLSLQARQLAVTARERETIRRKLEVTAGKLAVTASERESVRRRLVVTAENLSLKAKQLAVGAKERESIRRRLVVTAENLSLKAKQLAVTAKERVSIRRKLEVTAEKLAFTAKERESVRRRLVVTAQNLSQKAKQLAVTAKERESIRRRLAVTAENLSLKAKQLAATAKERESVRRRLAVTAIDLEQIRAKNEAMLESIGDGLVATDENEKILLVNKAFERILGWKESEVQGKLMSDLIPMVDETGKEIPSSERLITKTIKERTAVTTNKSEESIAASETKTAPGVYYYVRKDQTKFPVAVSVAPVKLDHKIIGTIEVFRDITREKEIDKAKSEFITLASHQLKTPPTAIKLLTERLLSGKVGAFTDKQKEYFDDIHSSNQRMIDLVNALLNVSRIELGAFTIKVNEKDVCIVVQSILDELKPVIDKKQLKLETTYVEKSVPVMLDEPLYHMVINNLVTNAVRYTAEGGKIEVLCEVVKKGQEVGGKLVDEDCFVVAVSDNGYGIPASEQRKVFTKFFRADNAREKLPDGTGLGLYIVKSVLDHSGGVIWFTSKENEGSVFYVSIPMSGMRTKVGKKELIDSQNS